MSLRFSKLQIPDVILIEGNTFKDIRGFFRETYKLSEFSANGIAATFVQDNHSHSVRGVIRGLHYQKQPKAQGKLVVVTRGEIFDVAVDLRKRSPTFGRWVSQVLSIENGGMLYVPPCFAHGFCALSAEADVMYKVTMEYSPELDRGIIWNDPAVGIAWPIPEPILSAKDTLLPLLKDADNNFEFEKI